MELDATVRLEVRVTGKVQDVAFRASARDHAERLGLVGHVRNQTDGSVTSAAEGPRTALEAYLRWLHHGPPAARVDAVESTWTEPEGGLTRFAITY